MESVESANLERQFQDERRQLAKDLTHDRQTGTDSLARMKKNLVKESEAQERKMT